MRRADEIIEEALKKGLKTPAELKSACVGPNLSKSSYHRHLNKLIKQRKVKQTKREYEWIGEREAEFDEVRDCMQAIKTETNTMVLLRRINQLQQLSSKRVAHHPGVISGLKECLGNPEVVNDSEASGELVFTIARILEFEQGHPAPNSDRIIADLINETWNRIVDRGPGLLDHATIFFLGLTGRKEAVEAIFRKIKEDPREAIQRINDLSIALGRQNLYKKYYKLINKRLDELTVSKNETLKEVAGKLHGSIIWRED